METNWIFNSTSITACSPKKGEQSLTLLKPTAPLQYKIPKRNTVEDALIRSSENDDMYLDSFPAGYRFCPFDEELVVYYLKKKLMNDPLPPNRMHEVNIYDYNPYDLAGMYKGYGDKEIYYFTPREKKYQNGSRPKRAAGIGYWKATGADKPVRFNGDVVGYKKALVFYEGKSPKGKKTNWIMHEYRVAFSVPKKRGPNSMRLDDWVLCRIYKKVNKGLKSRHIKEDEPSMATEETEDRISLDGDNGSPNGYANTANSYAGYMHNFFQQNAVPQIPPFPDLPLDMFNIGDQFELDADMSNIGDHFELDEDMSNIW